SPRTRRRRRCRRRTRRLRARRRGRRERPVHCRPSGDAGGRDVLLNEMLDAFAQFLRIRRVRHAPRIRTFRVPPSTTPLNGYAYRASYAKEHRVLRGENGNLVHRLAADGSLESVPPTAAGTPQLTAAVEASHQPAGQGRMGAFDITVKNAGPIPAFWVHVAATAPAATPGAEAPSFVFRWPPTLLRLDPGDSTRLRVEYSRAAPDDPKPAISRFVVAVRNAYDIGVPLEVPVDLRFQAADLSLDAQRPVRNSDGFAVPVTVTNVGDEPTGRQLALSARFLGGNGSAVDSDFKTVYDDGLAPGIATTFSLKAAKEVGSGPFRVELAAREGIAANIAAESTTIGFVNQWTRTSPSLSPRLFWPLYLALALGLVLVVAGGRLAVVYGNPVVVEVAREAQSLLRRPLGHLPGASRALERANRLDGALGSLGVVAERWRRAVAVAQTPGSAAAAFADVLGGRLGDALYEAAAFRFELPALNLRYGPCVGLASVEGPRMETGDAVRIANAMRAAELGSVVVLDLTEAQNASAAFRNVAQVETVILSSNLLRDVLLASAPQRVFERTVAEQRPMGEISPYRIAAGIEEPAVFVGRDEELRKLADRDLHSAVLVGARQMGKSSLLKAVARRLATRGDVE